MREAVIVSAARTPIGKAYRGAYNKTDAPTLGSYSIKEAVERAKVDPNEIEDVIMGCAQQQGSQALNIGRLSGIAAGKMLLYSDNNLLKIRNYMKQNNINVRMNFD